jgi:hypothetical protein
MEVERNNCGNKKQIRFSSSINQHKKEMKLEGRGRRRRSIS